MSELLRAQGLHGEPKIDLLSLCRCDRCLSAIYTSWRFPKETYTKMRDNMCVYLMVTPKLLSLRKRGSLKGSCLGSHLRYVNKPTSELLVSIELLILLLSFSEACSTS